MVESWSILGCDASVICLKVHHLKPIFHPFFRRLLDALAMPSMPSRPVLRVTDPLVWLVRQNHVSIQA
jgi:hypothetical protein